MNSDIRFTDRPKRQKRFRQTRRQLIEAARRIFARDGFESARVEDIASAIRKTRGAFYDHFADKEDIFFAIFEMDISHYLRGATRELKKARTRAERTHVLTGHFLRILKDRRRLLLILEFKMYAIRRPLKTRRLSSLHRTMCLQGTEAVLESLMPELQSRTSEARRRQNAQFGAILDGLLVNRLFDPAGLNDHHTKAFIHAALEAVLRRE